MQQKKQEWCFRLDQEKRFSDSSFFVTFTIEDDCLTYADDEPCVCKRDMQLFFKRLRKALKGDKIKYYCVGEYGDKWRPITPKGRPHYHALIFYKGSRDWFDVKLLIKSLWPLGIAQVLPVLGAQGYVTKYVLKFDKRDHLVKPFSLISHGLGANYLSDSMISYHRKNLIPYAIKPGGFKISLPRYYKDKIFDQHEKHIMKVRSDMHRFELECKKLDNFSREFWLGLSPGKKAIENYQHRLYQSMKIYREKKKL